MRKQGGIWNTLQPQGVERSAHPSQAGVRCTQRIPPHIITKVRVFQAWPRVFAP
ncbi:hypothetical protein [Limnohabitans sp.]|uniref:hypothetical protein n=1 Tax=Limnohabitans sp. TaxID=1907725 RepID=UPI00286FA2AA|nr:hypothetical protein [Limnohabitans sp.]